MSHREELDTDLLAGREDTLLRAAFEQAPLGVAVVAPDGCFRHANATIARLFGVPVDELVGTHWSELVHPADRGRVQRALAAAERTTDVVSVEGRSLRHDGTFGWIRAWGRALTTAQGEIAGFAVQAQDVTEDRARDDALTVQSQIAAHLGEGVVVERLEDRRLVYANRAMEEMLGHPAGSLVGSHVSDLLLPGSAGRDDPAPAIAEALSHGRWTGELRLRAADGRIVWVRVNAALFDHPEHGPSVVSTHVDVTERRRLHADLDRVWEMSRDYLAVVSFDGRLVRANPAMAAALDVSPSPQDPVAPGVWWTEIVHPDEADQARSALARGAAEGFEPQDFERRIRGRDGEWRWVAWRTRNDPEQQLFYLVGKDITERRREELHRAQLAAIVHSSSEAIASLDRGHRVTSWNPAAERMFAVPAAEALGRPVVELLGSSEDEAIERRLTRAMNGQEQPPREYDLRDGSVRVELTLFPLLDDQGTVTGASLVARDVSERRRAEERASLLGAIAANTQVAVVARTPDDVVTSWNPAAERLFGWTSDEIVGQSFARVVPDERAGESRAMVARAAAGERVHFDSTRLRRDGTRVAVSTSLAPIAAADGTVVGVATVILDLTDRRRAERQVAEERARMRTFLDNVPSVVSLKDREGRYVLVNDNFRRFFARTEDELIGRTDFDVFPRAFARQLAAADARVRGGLVPVSTEERVPVEGGEEGVYLSVKFPVFDDEGEFAGIGGVATDITAVRAAERERERLAALVESSQDVIVALSPEGAILSWNTGATAVLGVEAPEVLGHRVAELVPDELAQEVAGIIAAVLGGGRVTGRRMHLMRVDGTRVPVSLSASPIREPDGSVSAVSMIARDVSDLVLAERARDARARELARSNADLESFAYAASHDLQEPLRVISLAADVVRTGIAEDAEDGADNCEMLDLIAESARRMSEQIDALLALARIGQSPTPTEPVDADRALDDALASLGLTVAESGARIEREPLGTLAVDRAQLTTVFQNLIANAIKFAKPGEAPRVSITARRTSGSVAITVADEGVGIAPAEWEHIFRVFQRGGDRTRPGVGIGLSLVRTIVERHGGTIEVDGGPGEGTAFTLTFPAAR